MEKVITLEEALKRMKDYILENLMFRRLFVHDNRMFAERAFYCLYCRLNRSDRMVKGTTFSGESKNIESKVSLPDKSEKYVKTIVAFANTQGGKLIVGVDDKNHQVIGVENDILFQTMDAIATAVSDSCMPQIIPDIEPQTVEGKTIIIVSVEAGKNRPYYLKSKGKENGTYIRVAGTSRQAFPEKIKELEMEGARISWDELTCVGYTVTEEATEKLCQDIEVFRKKAGMSEYSVKKE